MKVIYLTMVSSKKKVLVRVENAETFIPEDETDGIMLREGTEITMISGQKIWVEESIKQIDDLIMANRR